MREVKLGTHDLPVIEQSLPYVERHAVPKLVEMVGGLQEAGNIRSVTDLLSALRGRVYDALDLFLPVKKTIPRHEWNGYASEQAMARDEYDEEALGRAVKHSQIVLAVEAIIAEHSFDVYMKLGGKLGAFVDPTVLRARVTLGLVDLLSSIDSPSLPSPNGDTPPERASGSDVATWSPSGSPAVESSSS